MKENRYKKLREDFEFTPNGYRMTADQLATIFKERGFNRSEIDHILKSLK